MAKEHVVLPDTSLCAIVRDEKMNPAGGIERFVDSHVPYVEQAVIADTGSVDGTREILEEMQAKYPNLKVVDFPFNGYADARNRSLKYVQTKRALILDADELLTHEQPQNDWGIIKEFIKTQPSNLYAFLFDVIAPNEIRLNTLKGHVYRLLDATIFECPFHRAVWEIFDPSFRRGYHFVKGVSIKHFVPSNEANELKLKEWYNGDEHLYAYLLESEKEKQIENWQRIPPSMREGFAKWKELNEFRENYI